MGGDGHAPQDLGAESALQDDLLPPTDATMHHTDSPEAEEIRDESCKVYTNTKVRVAGNTNGQSRGHVASVTNAFLQPVREWVEQNHADIPGVALDENGAVISTEALREHKNRAFPKWLYSLTFRVKEELIKSRIKRRTPSYVD